MGDCNVAGNGVDFSEVDQVLGLLRGHFARVVGTPTADNLHGLAHQTSVVGGTPPQHVTFKTHWVAPPKLANNTNDYQHQVLGDLGYL